MILQMKTTLLVFMAALELCAGGKILAMVSVPVRSHHIVIEKLALGLVKKGHEVTLVTSFKQSKPVPNLNEVIIPNLYKELSGLMLRNNNTNERDTSITQMRKMPKWFFLFMQPILGPTLNEMILSTSEVKELIEKNEKYDIILGETILMESILGGFSSKSKAPIVGVGDPSYPLGNPEPAAYIPNPFKWSSNPRMNFWQRLENLIFSTLMDISYRLLCILKQDAVMRKHFGDDLPPLSEIIKNTSLVLVHNHFSLSFPKPLLPNAVEIGGYHIDPPKPLPADLQKYFNESKHGVILFSLGSFISSSDLPKETKQAILKVFSRVKQDVLWKFEDDTLTDLPKNVKIAKWLPQSDLLAHPKLKLFITHGGLLSTAEAVQRGVPIVGIPVIADHIAHAHFCQDNGFGLMLELEDITEEVLYDAITEVVNNPIYRENMERRSAIMNDRPLPPLDTALYWIEYVIRHKGAPHFRSAAQDLSWYQLYLVDVLGFILIASSIIIYISTSITMIMARKLLSEKNSSVLKKKKEN